MTSVATVLLERRIGYGAPALDDRHRARVVRLEYFNQAEIHQFQSIFGCDLDITRFDIAVEHRRVLAVQKLQRVQKLRGPQQHLGLRKVFLLSQCLIHDLLQIAAFDKIHHQILAPVDGKIVRHLGQVGMIEPGQNTGFLVKLFNRLAEIQVGPPLVYQEGGQDLFDRADPPIQAQIVSAVDRAHSALTHQPDNFIASTQNGVRIQHCRQETPL